ncbi:PEP-CTERM system TPR-repeat protein PrsT [Thalassotalea euphylliae]|uniref:PEP-CTERM system TPR-repeat protein PrsT n=1 Tax=Thalassotalea euphylliae TaxID=1655234 RepID=A0A3E0TPF0_9GAMM|nr:XrtA/PEP-CTERM system TPR-repeat protein PrsT [Thalassotalea euphylliae]REL26313.1 PEP-CTERM system TPR-repeat protein PrsT [Thalassotalea euphylliae]
MVNRLPSLYLALLLSSISINVYANQDYENALSAYQNNDVDAAYVHLKNALHAEQDSLPAKILMGKVMLSKGLYRDGLQEFEEAALMGADANQFIFEQARSMLLLGRHQEMIDLLNKLSLSQQNSIKTLPLKSIAYSALNQYQPAHDALITAKQLAPNNINVLSSLTNFYIANRQFKQAKEEITQLLTLAADNSKVWNLYAEFYKAQGLQKEALNALEKAYQLDSNDPIILRALAHMYTDEKQYEKALKIVEDIITATPNDPYARLLKSQLLTNTNQLEQAQQLLNDISAKLSLLTDAQKNSQSSLAYVSGTAAFMQGNLELAQKELIFFVNSNPDDLSGLNMLTAIYLQQGQTDKVQTLLERNEPVIAKDLLLSLKLFEIYQQNNNIYKAKNILENLEKTYPNNRRVISAKASYLAFNKRFDEAIELLNHNAPEQYNASYELNRSLIYIEMGEYPLAHKIADQLLTIAPDNISFLNLKGVIYLREQQWQAAIKQFQQIVKQAPQFFSASYNLANAYARSGDFTQGLSVTTQLLSNNKERDDLRLLHAKLLRDTQQPDEAIAYIEQILSNNSSNQRALDTLLSIQYQQKNFISALETANKLTDLTFLEPKYLLYKANILIELAQFQEAEKTIGILLGLARNADEYYQLSLLYEKVNNLDAAATTLAQALTQQPDNLLLLLTQAKFAIQTMSPNQAKQLIVELDRQFPNNANVQLLFGNFWLKQQKPQKAQQAFLRALSLDNNFREATVQLYLLAVDGIGKKTFSSTLEAICQQPNALAMTRNLLADFYLINKEYRKAKHHYEQLLATGLTNSPNILNNLALIYMDLDLAKAKQFAERALVIAPDSAAIIDTLAWIMVKQGEYDKALKKLRNANALNSEDPAISYHIGYTLHKLERDVEAKIALEKALNSTLDFKGKSDAKDLLRVLAVGEQNN